MSTMDRDRVRDRLDAAVKKLNAYKWHLETLKEMHRRAEKKTVSGIKESKNVFLIKDKPQNVSEAEINQVYAQVRAATEEQLQARCEVFYAVRDIYDLSAEIEALEAMIAEYIKHVEVSRKEAERFYTDKEILEKLTQIEALPLFSIDKAIVQDWRTTFESGSIVSRQDKIDFYDALEAFYRDNC